jgi:hypothetical protein
LGNFLSDFAAGSLLLDRASLEAQQAAAAALLVACGEKIRVMDNLKTKDFQNDTEMSFEWEEPSSLLQKHLVSAILENFSHARKYFDATLLDKFGARSRRLIGALCLQNWLKITSKYKFGPEVLADRGKYLASGTTLSS